MITYNALISACDKGKKPEQAMELFEAMKRQVVVHDVITYSASIRACEKGQKLEEAMALFEAMK